MEQALITFGILSGSTVVIGVVGKIILWFQSFPVDLLYPLVQLLFGRSLGFWKQEYFMGTAWKNIEILPQEIRNLIHQIFTGHQDSAAC